MNSLKIFNEASPKMKNKLDFMVSTDLGMSESSTFEFLTFTFKNIFTLLRSTALELSTETTKKKIYLHVLRQESVDKRKRNHMTFVQLCK